MSENQQEMEITGKDLMNPTFQRVRNIVQDIEDHVARGEKPNIYEIQKKHGYSDVSARQYAVKKTKAWDKIMEQKVKDEELVNRLDDIAQNGKDSDSIKAIKEMFKLKGRYPTKKSATFSVQKTISDLKE